MSRIHQTLFDRDVRQSVDGGLGFGHVTVGGAIEQCLHQNTGGRNANLKLSCKEQVVDGFT